MLQSAFNTIEEDVEEIKEATASRAAAKESSMDAAGVAVLSELDDNSH